MARHGSPRPRDQRPGDVTRRGPVLLLTVVMLLLAVSVASSFFWTRHVIGHSLRTNDRQFCELLSGIAVGPRATTPYGRHQQDSVVRLYHNLGCPNPKVTSSP